MDPLKPGEGQRDVPLTGAHIGRSVIIKGELSGSENLYVDGEVQGSIQLDGHSLTIGQNGRVHANLKAKDIVVQGRVDGSVSASDRVDLRKTAVVMGDVKALRLAVEDGAFLKGNVETTRADTQASSQVRSETKQQVTAVSPIPAGNPAPAVPVSAAESKG